MANRSREGTRATVAVADRFYGALGAGDPRALLDVLDSAFEAQVTAGLPQGWGGTYRSAKEMLERCWGPIFAVIDMRPVPERFLETEGDCLVVLGRYQGSVRPTGAELDAAFVHVLRVRNGRLAELAQITDSARWHEALAVGGSPPPA